MRQILLPLVVAASFAGAVPAEAVVNPGLASKAAVETPPVVEKVGRRHWRHRGYRHGFYGGFGGWRHGGYGYGYGGYPYRHYGYSSYYYGPRYYSYYDPYDYYEYKRYKRYKRRARARRIIGHVLRHF